MPPEILSDVASLLDEGSRRITGIARFCTGSADCCRFRLTGETPYVTIGEAWLVRQAWKASGRTKVPDTADGSCPFLATSGKCLVYSNRPLACRTHFCEAAGGTAPRKMIIDIIRQLEEIDSRAGGCGAIRLPDAVKRLSKNH